MPVSSGASSVEGNIAETVRDSCGSEDTAVVGSFDSSPVTSSEAVVEHSMAASSFDLSIEAQSQAVEVSETFQKDDSSGIEFDEPLAPATTPASSSTAREEGSISNATPKDKSECSGASSSVESRRVQVASKTGNAGRSHRAKPDCGAPALQGLFEVGPSDVWPLNHGRVVCWVAGRPYAMLRDHETVKEVAAEFGLRANDLLLVNAGLFPTLKLTSHLMSGTLLLLPWIEADELDEVASTSTIACGNTSSTVASKSELEGSGTISQLLPMDEITAGAEDGENAVNVLGFHPSNLVNLSRVELQSLAVKIGAPAKVPNEDLRQALSEWHRNAHGDDKISSRLQNEDDEESHPTTDILPMESGVSSLPTSERSLEATHVAEKSLPGPVYRKAVVLLDEAGHVIAEYASQRLASDALGMGPSSISECVRGKHLINGLRLCLKRPNGDYPTIGRNNECSNKCVSSSSTNSNSYGSDSTRSGSGDNNYRDSNLAPSEALSTSRAALLLTSTHQATQSGASDVRAVVERLLIRHGWIPRELPAYGNGGSNSSNSSKKRSREGGSNHDHASTSLQRQQQWAPPPSIAAVAPSGYALVESSVAAVRLHGGVVIDGLPFASPQQVWPWLKAAVDRSSADFVTSDPLKRPHDVYTVELKEEHSLDVGDDADSQLPDGITWSSNIERYHSWFDDSTPPPQDANSGSTVTTQVYRYYLGAYASVQEADDARDIAAAALDAHHLHAAVAAASSTPFVAGGRRCQCLVELPAGKVLILVLPCTHAQSSSPPFNSSSEGPYASNIGSSLEASNSSSNVPKSKSAGKRKRLSSGSSRAKAKDSNSNSATTMAVGTVVDEFTATSEKKATMLDGASSTSSWSSEAAARCQRALMAYGMGHKLPGTPHVTGDWVMAKWAHGLWFFAKVTGSSGPGFVDVIYEDGAFESKKPRARVRALTSAEKHKPRASLFGTLSFSTARKGWVANYLDEGLEVPGTFDTPQAAELALLDYHQRGAKRRRDVVVLPTEHMNSVISTPDAAAAPAMSVVSASDSNADASARSSGGRRHRLLTRRERFGPPPSDAKSYLANAVTQRSHTVGFYEAVADANPEWRRTVPAPTQRCSICLEEYGEAETAPLYSTCSDNDSNSSSSSSKRSKKRSNSGPAVSAGGAVLVGSGAYAVRMKCCMNWFHVACTIAHASAISAHQDQDGVPAVLLQCPMCRDEKTYARQLRQVRRDLSHLAPQLAEAVEPPQTGDKN